MKRDILHTTISNFSQNSLADLAMQSNHSYFSYYSQISKNNNNQVCCCYCCCC